MNNLSVKFDGHELSDYLVVQPGFSRGISGNNEVKLKKIGLGQGQKLVSVSYNEKIIPMPFFMKNNLIVKRRELEAILSVTEPKELIFGDEPDKVYYALPESEIDFSDEKMYGSANFNWLVPDGMSHSITLTPITAEPNETGILSMDINYDGVVDTPLQLKFHNNAETGYLSVIGIHEDQATFLTQLGYMDEADGEVREKMATIFEKDGGKSFANWKDASVFYENQSKKVVTTMSSITDYGGWLGKLPSSFTNNGGVFYGACKELVLPTAAQSCYLWARAWFETAVMGQTGEWCLAYVDETNKFIAGMAIEKSDAVGNSAMVNFLIGDGSGGSRVYKTMPLTPSYWQPPNPYGTESRLINTNMFDLKKENDKITYFFNGSYYTVTIPALQTKKVKKVQFFTGQYGSRPASKLVTHMGIRDVLVIDLKSQYWQDLPNRFKAGTDVEIRQDSGMNMIYRDGIKTLEDFVTGSTFPILKPGNNHIEFGWSGFTTTPPTITGTYEKRWY
ncbi:distal tail protein Dit [Enterococcus sp. LJL120]